eukprot:scaffold569_cov408-Prasinococcus_capsulatus_cf.AAC.17
MAAPLVLSALPSTPGAAGRARHTPLLLAAAGLERGWALGALAAPGCCAGATSRLSLVVPSLASTLKGARPGPLRLPLGRGALATTKETTAWL